MLKRRGITRVRPLAGGLSGWREKGYPLQVLQIAPKTTAMEQTPSLPDTGVPVKPSGQL